MNPADLPPELAAPPAGLIAAVREAGEQVYQIGKIAPQGGDAQVVVA